jgi:REP-associated tyrosine transposase
MVAAYHLIWTAYGWWLPNDPRGSSSQSIRVAKIAELGELHFGRRAIQPTNSTLRQFDERARELLAHRVYELDSEERNLVGRAFGITT